MELAAEDYYFAPTFLQGEPGQTLMLEIENASGALHNWPGYATLIALVDWW
jgi:hypothetical protein